MALTKKQKIYGTVLTSAAAAFAWDFLSGDDKHAPPAAADLLIHSAAVATPAGPNLAPAPFAENPRRAAIAIRLQHVASTERLDPDNVNSAFSLGPAWLPEKPASTNAIAKVAGTTPPDPAKDFARRHRLDAVMVRTRGGYAIVDGQGVFVGQQCERFRLVSVTRNTAVFVWNDERVELHIVRPGELLLDGSVISNRTQAVGAQAGAENKPATEP